MFTIMTLAGFVVMLMVFAVVIAIPALLLGGLIWLITLPFRLFFGLIGMVFGLVFGLIGIVFRVVFGIIGGVLGLLFAPVILTILGVLLVGALIVGLISLLAPLVPVLLLALLGWAIYRISTRRPSPTF
jgi:hypothetical protein